MPARPCIFLSASSQEFEPARADLAALLRKKGYEVKVQEDFHQGPATTWEKVEDYIRQCSHVICLMGLRHGGEPPAGTVPADTDTWLRTAHSNVPLHSSGVARLSYTQWEFYLALRYHVPLYVFTATANWPDSVKVTQTAEDAVLQQAHLSRVKALGWDRDYFGTWDDLKERILILPIPTELRPGLDFLPFASLGPLFKGRDQFLLTIRRDVETSLQQSGHMPNHAIHALGGVGKTRVALEYAWRHGDLYSSRLFLTARSPQDLEDQLATLCEILNLPEKNLPELAPRLQAALRWLGAPENKHWLLILDNVDDDATARAIEARLASFHHGHLLICGRITQWNAHLTTLELPELSPEASRDFLLDRTTHKRAAQDDTTDAASALALAADLGHLALALEQAAAYIALHRVSFAAYQKLLQANLLKVLNWTHHTVTDYERPVAATWLTSISQLSEEAKDLLHLLSEYSPAPIPRFLFESEMGQSLLEPLSELRNHSLITDSTDGQSFTVHRLVQQITRAQSTTQSRCDSLADAISLINESSPGEVQDARSWPFWNALLPHGLEITSDPTWDGKVFDQAWLLDSVGTLLKYQARHAEGEPLLRRALSIDENRYGTEHPFVSIRLNNLATLLHDTNQLTEAELLLRRALAIEEKIHSEPNPIIALRLSNLAALLHDMNQIVESEKLMRKALTVSELFFDSRGKEVSVQLNNLAELLRDTGRREEAEQLTRRAIELLEQNDPGDPSIAVFVSNLALLAHDAGRLAEAEQLHRRALSINEYHYGTSHPIVARNLGCIAVVLSQLDQPIEAERLIRQSLAINEIFHTRSHPNVVVILGNLACILQDNGKSAEAEQVMREVLELAPVAFGKDHPKVAAAFNNLASLLKLHGRLDEAEPLLRQSLLIAFNSQPNNDLILTNTGLLVGNYARLCRGLNLPDSDIRQRLEFLRAESGLSPTAFQELLQDAGL